MIFRAIQGELHRPIISSPPQRARPIEDGFVKEHCLVVICPKGINYDHHVVWLARYRIHRPLRRYQAGDAQGKL